MKKISPSPEEILNLVKSTPLRIREEYTYVILGQTGPTGKSWITQKLKEIGCNAVEISEYVNQRISYPIDGNSCTFDDINKTCVIILNNLLK